MFNIFSRIVFVILGIILVNNQANYLFGGDSAEYSTALSTFSIPHPPGYPLYSLIGNIITRVIPFGSITWKISLLSSIPTLLTSIFIYLILCKLTKNKPVSLLSSIFYIALFPIWLFAEVPEVFALNNLFIIVITYLILQFNDFHQNKLKYLIFLFIGLSIAHHHTFILFVPGWYFLINKTLRKQFFLSNRLKALFFLIIGVSFYIYAIVASYFSPPIDWENSQTLAGLVRLITRSSYGTFNAYAGSSPNIINQVFNFFSTFIFIIQDFRILGIIFITLGIIQLIKNLTNFSKFLIITTLIEFFFLFYTNFYLKSSLVIATFERYLLSFYLIFIFYFAFGLLFINNFITNYLHKIIINNKLKKFSLYIFYFFIVAYMTIIIVSNYSIIKSIKNTVEFENYGYDILKTIPKNSILYVSGDISYFTTQNLYSVKLQRNDIKLIYANLLTRDYYSEKIKKIYPDIIIPSTKINETVFFKDFLEINSKKYSIFYEYPSQYGGYWQPYGLLWKYYSTSVSAKNDSENLITINNILWSKYHFPVLQDKQKNILYLNHLREIYRLSLNNYLNFLIINNKFNLIQEYLTIYKDLIDPKTMTDIQAKMALQNKDCIEMKKQSNHYINKNPYELALIQLEFVIKYYGLCDKNNKNVYKYLKVYKKFNL